MLQTTVKDTTKTEYIAIYCRTATYDCVSIESQKAESEHCVDQNLSISISKGGDR